MAPCRTGCTVKDLDSGESVPVPTAGSSRYCDPCESRARTALASAGELVGHLIGLHGVRIPARKPADGSHPTKAPSAPLPFNVQVVDDADTVYASLVHQALVWSRLLGRPAAIAARYAWRDATGHTAGLRSDLGPDAASHAVGQLAEWLDLHLDLALRSTHEDADGAMASLLSDLARVVRIGLRWPTTDRPTFSRKAVCPNDGARLRIAPPADHLTDRLITCTECGLHLSEDEHDQLAAALLEVTRQARRTHTTEQAAA
jgi:hypothetical protein